MPVEVCVSDVGPVLEGGDVLTYDSITSKYSW